MTAVPNSTVVQTIHEERDGTREIGSRNRVKASGTCL